MVSSEKSFGDLKAELAGAYDCNFHIVAFLNEYKFQIIVSLLYIIDKDK